MEVTFAVVASEIRWQGAIQHGAAEVHQGDVELGQAFEQLQRVVARAAADIEHVPRGRRDRRGRAHDQIHRQRRVHRGRLAGLQVGEPLDVRIEALTDFLDGRFFHTLPLAYPRL